MDFMFIIDNQNFNILLLPYIYMRDQKTYLFSILHIPYLLHTLYTESKTCLSILALVIIISMLQIPY
jgi:hypothetical protein